MGSMERFSTRRAAGSILASTGLTARLALLIPHVPDAATTTAGAVTSAMAAAASAVAGPVAANGYWAAIYAAVLTIYLGGCIYEGKTPIKAVLSVVACLLVFGVATSYMLVFHDHQAAAASEHNGFGPIGGRFDVLISWLISRTMVVITTVFGAAALISTVARFLYAIDT